jgi:trimeric autotransporter adhesin
MTKIHGVVFSLLLLFLSGSSIAHAQQSAATMDKSHAGNQGVTAAVSGTGKKDYVPMWLTSTSLGDSKIFQNSAGEVGIGTTAPSALLDVNGTVNAATGFNLGGSVFAFGTLSEQNAFVGFSGNSSMTGVDNTGTGVDALQSNTTGYENTASGYGALRLNTTGFLNTATGLGALAINTTGQQNTATGGEALQNNTTGNLNTATGAATLAANTTGYYNTAEGWSALKFNTTGAANTASGYGALGETTTGGNNTAVGMLALYYNTTGNSNTALGYGAGPDINSTALTNSTAIGYGAIVSQSNSLVLGSVGVKVGIGTATPSNVFTIAQGAGPAVSDGWSVYSSRRWKTNIHTLHGALEKVEQLRGVSYDLQANGKHEVGVIAEEVGAVVPEVVTWDKTGKDAQSVDYSRLTALLIEATKEQQTVIHQQQEQIKTQQAQIARLCSQMKTVRAAVRANGPTASEVQTVKARMEPVRQ